MHTYQFSVGIKSVSKGSGDRVPPTGGWNSRTVSSVSSGGSQAQVKVPASWVSAWPLPGLADTGLCAVSSQVFPRRVSPCPLCTRTAVTWDQVPYGPFLSPGPSLDSSRKTFPVNPRCEHGEALAPPRNRSAPPGKLYRGANSAVRRSLQAYLLMLELC